MRPGQELFPGDNEGRDESLHHEPVKTSVATLQSAIAYFPAGQFHVSIVP
jgi:hypothetical protein